MHNNLSIFQGPGLLGAAPPSIGPPGEGQDKGDKPPPLMSLQVSAPKEETPREVKLPQALEQALAFKTERAKQVSVLDGTLFHTFFLFKSVVVP